MLRVLYAGSPEPSALTLELLLKNAPSCGYEVCGVLTNPPSSQGRHKTPVPTFVEQVARKNNILVFNPEHLDSVAREEVSRINADILVVFAYGHIFGPKFMSLFKFGGINLHPSALPKYRGCTPVNAAILNGDLETAFTIQKVSQKMDEGDILASQSITLTGKETCVSLLHDAAISGASLLSDILKQTSQNGDLPVATPQTGEPSYTGFIKKEDAKIDWSKPSHYIDCFVRAYYYDPNAWTLEKDIPLKIMSGIALSDKEGAELGADLNAQCGSACLFNKSKGILVKCGSGFYAITELQRQGKKPMDYKSFMNGARDFIGTLLG